MKDPFIAIQIGAVSLLDEGTEHVLDFLSSEGAVNALFLTTHSFDPGTASRQIKGYPFPDHGKKEYDQLVGGNFCTLHPEFYKKTFIDNFRAPDYGPDYDVLEDVLPHAKKRGMKVYCWVTESPNYNLARIIPGFSNVMEITHTGKKGRQPCLNNPDYRNMYTGLYEDYVKSYPVDGLALCSERQGPLGNLLIAGWGSWDVSCFCPYCRARARDERIDVDRAVEGYTALAKLFASFRKEPSDEAFVLFWRMLLEYPEILGWERLFRNSQFDFYRDLYGTVKAIDSRVQVGWHIMHLRSLNPFYRATQDYGKLAEFSDFVKLALYQNCAGTRFRNWVDNLKQHIFSGSHRKTITRLVYDMLGHEEAGYDDLSDSAFSGAYVEREVRQAVREFGDSTAVYAGIGIDVPNSPSQVPTREAELTGAIQGAFKAGASGLILSRKYSEMTLGNIRTAGRAIRSVRGI